MTKQELNRDIKRLAKKYSNRISGDTSDWTRFDWDDYHKEQNEMKQEFKRLYGADTNFEAMNRASIRIMLSINTSLRVISLHIFGWIETDKL